LDGFKDKDIVASLKKDLTNRTIVGEYCGNQNYQHLIKYDRVTLIWFAVIDNDSLKNECVDLVSGHKFFKHYGLDVVDSTVLGTFSSFYELNYVLLKYFDEVARGRIEVHHEGAVLYFEVQPTADSDEPPRVLIIPILRFFRWPN
jgi:tRNA splicing ligase